MPVHAEADAAGRVSGVGPAVLPADRPHGGEYNHTNPKLCHEVVCKNTGPVAIRQDM